MLIEAISHRTSAPNNSRRGLFFAGNAASSALAWTMVVDGVDNAVQHRHCGLCALNRHLDDAVSHFLASSGAYFVLLAFHFLE